MLFICSRSRFSAREFFQLLFFSSERIFFVLTCLSRREFIKKVEQYKAQREKELLDIKRHAARRMQALIRGVLGRMKFKKNLPALKRAQKVRGICCECETNVAVRRCRQCKDKYCASCYERIHAKGKQLFPFLCFVFVFMFSSVSQHVCLVQ